MARVKVFLDNLLRVPTPDPDVARRGKLLNVLLLSVGVGAIGFLIGGLLTNISDSWTHRDEIFLVVSTILALVFVFALYFLNHSGSIRLASIAFPIGLVILISISDEPQYLVAGRSTMLYILPIIVAGVLLRPSASLVMVALTGIALLALALLNNLDLVPLYSAIPFEVMLFFIFALVIWLASSSLENAHATIQRKRDTVEVTSPRSLRVFLCHSSADKPAVRELYQRLRADGFDAWLDEENLLPGQDWQVEIANAVHNADTVVVCLSRGAMSKSGYVQKEIKFALDAADEKREGTIFLVPLKLEEGTVPERLNRWQWVNLFSPNGYERLLRALHKRAADLNLPAVSTPSSKPVSPPKSEASGAPVSHVSGGVNVTGEQVHVGNDMVGRDKVIQATTYIEHATIIQSGASVQELKPSTPTSTDNRRVMGGMEFVRVPAGKFLMGSPAANQLADSGERPQHMVEIPYDYWIAHYPVTNEQFAEFVTAAKHEFNQGRWQAKADHPVVAVSWRDALAYCQWLNDTLRGELKDLTLRLPTEAEWEKAARGTQGNEWPWGNDWDPKKCNSREGRKGGTTPVGAYSPQGDGPYGVADMAGNVWEWCHSLHKPYPYQGQDGREDAASKNARVLRGGSWYYDRGSARCASRYSLFPADRYDYYGFRCVLSGVRFREAS